MMLFWGMGLLFPGQILGANTGSDEFIAGYATAVLELYFGAQACSVQVKDGTMTVSGQDLDVDVRDKAVEQLKQIPGVTRVVVKKADSELSQGKGVVPTSGSRFPPSAIDGEISPDWLVCIIRVPTWGMNTC